MQNQILRTNLGVPDISKKNTNKTKKNVYISLSYFPPVTNNW